MVGEVLNKKNWVGYLQKRYVWELTIGARMGAEVGIGNCNGHEDARKENGP
jgi:hypothetical protein